MKMFRNVLVVMVALPCECTESYWIVRSNMVNFMLCEFYLTFKRMSRQQRRASDFTVLGWGFFESFPDDSKVQLGLTENHWPGGDSNSSNSGSPEGGEWSFRRWRGSFSRWTLSLCYPMSVSQQYPPAWELVRNIDLPVPPQSSWVTIWLLARSPWFTTHWSSRSTGAIARPLQCRISCEGLWFLLPRYRVSTVLGVSEMLLVRKLMKFISFGISESSRTSHIWLLSMSVAGFDMHSCPKLFGKWNSFQRTTFRCWQMLVFFYKDNCRIAALGQFWIFWTCCIQ